MKLDIIKSSARAESWLMSNHFPYSDDIQMISSSERFEDGSSYGIEIPVINSMNTLEKTIYYL
ncbi:MAG: hypothetical protein QM752_05990 [Gammaproteobacteria bacterium]